MRPTVFDAPLALDTQTSIENAWITASHENSAISDFKAVSVDIVDEFGDHRTFSTAIEQRHWQFRDARHAMLRAVSQLP
jgi:hypothetical protein